MDRKEKLFNVIDYLKEELRRYYGVREYEISNIFRWVDEAYNGKFKSATPEERKQIQEILGKSDEEFETIWCFWKDGRLYAKNNRGYWSSLAGRLWGIDLENRKFSTIVKS